MPARRTPAEKSPAPRGAAPRSAGRRAAARAVASGDASNRRADLIRVAARLFRDQGFNGTSTRDIADAVGMRSGSPFYHFANKHELLTAVMEEGLRLGLERMRAALDGQASGGSAGAPADPLARFRLLVRVHYGILHDAGSDFIPVMLHDWHSLPARYKRRIIELKDRYDTIWQETLDALHAQGRLRADARLARLMILGAINFSATWYRPQPRAEHHVDLDELAAQTVALVLAEAPAQMPAAAKRGNAVRKPRA